MTTRWCLLLVVTACGSKGESAPKLPATIKYELKFASVPESDHGPVAYALKVGDKEYDLVVADKDASVEIELPSSTSLLAQPAAVVIKGLCKSNSIPTTFSYLDTGVKDAKAEQAYLAKEAQGGAKVSVYFSVAADAVKPFLPVAEPTRIYIDRGDATTSVKLGTIEIPKDQTKLAPTPDCEGAPIFLGDKQVSTYLLEPRAFAKANPSTEKVQPSQASLFIAADPALCYQWATKTYGATQFPYTVKAKLTGGAAHVIGSREVDFFLEEAPAEVMVDAALSFVSREELVRKPCPTK